MKKAGEIISKRSYYKTLESSYICYTAQNILQKFYPDKKIFAVSYKNGNLKIKAENNYILGEIKLNQKKIISEINLKIKKSQIKKISQ